MNLEILFLAESPTASWEDAMERLCTIMQMHVSPKANLTRELLVATGVMAGKGLFGASLLALHT